MFAEKLLELTDQCREGIEFDPVQASRQVVRELSFGKAALDDDFTLRLVRQRAQST
jgi:hypothetical protein